MQQQREIEGAPVEQPELLHLGRAPRPAKQVIMTCNSEEKLKATLRRERARKAIVVRSAIKEVQPGLWGVYVTQLRPPRPVWVRPALVAGGVLGGLTGLAALGWALVSLLVGVTAGVPMAAVVGAVVLAGAAAYGLRRGKPSAGGGDVQVDVSVRVRR